MSAFYKKGLFVFIIVLLTLMCAGCFDSKTEDSSSLNISSNTASQTEKPTTLDDAVKWYLNEKEASKYSKGQHFVSAYRILDTEETSDSVTVYTHILCEWISSSGETVSGGAGLISITFKNNNNAYEYEKSVSYDGQQIPGASEIPQKVKDAVKDAAYFPEMRTEVENRVAALKGIAS